jgi:ribonuclease HI
MYFISEVLSDSKACYPQIQKLLYAVLIAKRKLLHYFKSHPVTVVMSFPLSEVVQNRDATGRIVKWALELMGQGISYAPWTAIKSQVLADFVVEWTEIQILPAVINQEYWTMYFNVSLMKKGISAGLVFVSPLEVRIRYMVRIHFPSSNNVAKYETLINGLHIAIELGIRQLDVRGDSQLVIDQVMKESSYHNAKMIVYCQEVCQLEDKFDGLELNHILRHLNEAADALAKMASDQEPVPMGVFTSDQYKPSVRYKEPK